MSKHPTYVVDAAKGFPTRLMQKVIGLTTSMIHLVVISATHRSIWRMLYQPKLALIERALARVVSTRLTV